jgi:hypothetical protein
MSPMFGLALRRFDHPARHLLHHGRVLAHRGTHVALGVAVRAREVALEGVDAALADAARQLLPALLVVLLHDRRDQDVLRVLLLEPLEVVQPVLERPV